MFFLGNLSVQNPLAFRRFSHPPRDLRNKK